MQIFNEPSPRRIFAIDAIAYRHDGGRFQRRMMVNLLRQPEIPFAILEWRQARSDQPFDDTIIGVNNLCINE